jgi:hypothetical protein
MLSGGKLPPVVCPDERYFYQELTIPGPLPGLNDMVANGPHGRFKYQKLKKRWAEAIALLCVSQKLRPVKRAKFHYYVVEPNRRRDPSNFCFGAAKFIEDALQAAGYLATDGWDGVYSFSFEWQLAGSSLKPHVAVCMDVTEEWEASENERRQKGRNKFRRGAAGHQVLPRQARKAQRPRNQAARAKVSARGTGR